jgi:hypothetical protein
MWHLEVPKLAHFYWGGNKLTYLRYLTIKTFIKYNLDWQVIFWYPQRPHDHKYWQVEKGREEINYATCKDYLPELKKLPVTFIPVDFERLNFYENFPEVHKNDYIRINVLLLYGGLWSDMDIIYFRPMGKLKVNIPANKDKEMYVCISDYGHSTGFNMAREGNAFCRKLLDVMNSEYNPKNYQCWGPDLWNKYFRKIDSIPGSVNMSMDAVYAHNCYNVKELLNGSKERFNDESIGCHWYGGNSLWGAFLNSTKGGETNLSNNIIGRLIKNAN